MKDPQCKCIHFVLLQSHSDLVSVVIKMKKLSMIAGALCAKLTSGYLAHEVIK
jgi:hypothetical protein